MIRQYTQNYKQNLPIFPPTARYAAPYIYLNPMFAVKEFPVPQEQRNFG
jgi:hypothetical protein